MKLYKLTDANGRTQNDCQWGPGVEHMASGEGPLCGPGWLHAYAGSKDDPDAGALLAVLLNPLHADITEPVLWEAEGEVGATDHGLKVGCTRLRTIKQVPLPVIALEQRVRFGILSALGVCHEKGFCLWATMWLEGTDRSRATAEETARSAWATAASEAAEAKAEAWAAAAAAARAARAASWTAGAAKATVAEATASEAAAAATWAAQSGALDLTAIARAAMKPQEVSLAGDLEGGG